jgi:transposase-like protein
MLDGVVSRRQKEVYSFSLSNSAARNFSQEWYNDFVNKDLYTGVFSVVSRFT